MIHVVVFQPENAGNLGNIIRSCYIHQAQLHLIRPYGWVGNLRYFTHDVVNHPHAQLLRATVDCFHKIIIHEHNCPDDFLKQVLPGGQVIFFSKHGHLTYQQYLKEHYQKNNPLYLVFGAETYGLTNWEGYENQGTVVTLEPVNTNKCHNLANAVAIGLYGWIITN